MTSVDLFALTPPTESEVEEIITTGGDITSTPQEAGTSLDPPTPKSVGSPTAKRSRNDPGKRNYAGKCSKVPDVSEYFWFLMLFSYCT